MKDYMNIFEKIEKSKQTVVARKIKTDIQFINLMKSFMIYKGVDITYENYLEIKEPFYDYFNENKAIITKTFFPKKPKIKAYFITLTSHPTAKLEDYKTAYEKIKSYKKFKISYIYGVVEYTKKDNPHLHIYCEAKDYVRLDRVKRIWTKSSVNLKRAFDKKGLDKYLSKDSKKIDLK